MARHDDGQQLIQTLTMVGHILPDAEELNAFVQACHRDESVGPIFHPAAWMRAKKRLPALRKLAEAAVRYRAAWEELQEAAREESDPDLDEPARDMVAAERRRMAEEADDA